jgi:hypothetical protein
MYHLLIYQRAIFGPLEVWVSGRNGRRMRLFAGWLCGAILGGAAPLAAEPVSIDRTVKAQSGRDVRVGIFTSLKSDCTAGQLPTLRLKEMPKNGKVTVKQGRWRATNFRQCLATDVPAFIAIYRSEPHFAGRDELVLEVITASGKVQLQRIQVMVEKPVSGQSL